MNNRIYIDGKDYSRWASGLDDITESFSLQDDGIIELGQSSTVTLTGEGYTFWYNELFLDSCNSIDKEYNVKIKIGSCNVQLDFILKSQGVSIDTLNCSVKLNLNTKNEIEDQYKILTRYAFTEEGFIDYVQGLNRIPRMLFVNEISLITKYIALIWHIVLLPLRALLIVIGGIINGIITALNTLLIDDIDKINISEFFKDVGDDVIGAGEYTTVFYIKDIFEFWATKAGLNFQSSILQTDPYQDSVLFAKQYGRGIEINRCDSVIWDSENDPNLSPVEVFNLVKPLHNAEWKIINDILYYERKDFFDNLSVQAFVLESEVKGKKVVDTFEYTFDNSKQYARFSSELRFDTVDTQGNRALPFYRHIEEWNPGLIHKNRKGTFAPQIATGALRCTEDKWRDSFNSFFWGSFGQIKYNHSIVLSQGFASNLKVFILEKTPGLTHRGCPFYFVKKQQLTQPNNADPDYPDLTGKWEYNTDYWHYNLYKLFYYIDNPDLKNERFIEINSLTLQPGNFCELVNFMRENKMNTFVNSKYGKGNISGFSIKYGSCSIQFSEIKFKCTNGG